MLYRNPNQMQVFSKEWFEYQEPALLKLVNHEDRFLSEFWRNSMGISKDYDQAIISKLRHDCFHLYDGSNQRVGVFYSGNPIAKDFQKNLILLWKCAHTYDAIAKMLRINSNLGFDTLNAYSQSGSGGSNVTCDGYISYYGTVFSDIYYGGGDSVPWEVEAGQVSSYVGQVYSPDESIFYVYRHFQTFDTTIGNLSSITAVTINFKIAVRYMDGNTCFPLDIMTANLTAANSLSPSDFYSLVGTVGVVDTPTLYSNDMIGVDFPSYVFYTINKTGVSKFGMQFGGTEPTGSNVFSIYSAEAVAESRPYLTVTYTLPSTGQQHQLII